MPETHVIDTDDWSDDEEEEGAGGGKKKEEGGGGDGVPPLVMCPPLARLAPRLRATGGLWVLKGSEANRGEQIHFVDVGKADGLPNIQRVLGDSLPGTWVLQRYVRRPRLLQGRKFHLRIHALAVGDLDLYMHDNK